jgi:hypothetical protein
MQDAGLAQFGASVSAFRSFARIRRARNTFEYPSDTTPGPSTDDVDDAIASATAVYEAAKTILKQNMLTQW